MRPMTLPVAEDVLLRDGSALRLRTPTPADEAELIAFFRALSPDSRYLRFHGATSVGHATVAGALDTDWRSRGSLLAELADRDGVMRPVALATYVRLHDPRRAERSVATPVSPAADLLGLVRAPLLRTSVVGRPLYISLRTNM